MLMCRLSEFVVHLAPASCREEEDRRASPEKEEEAGCAVRFTVDRPTAKEGRLGLRSTTTKEEEDGAPEGMREPTSLSLEREGRRWRGPPSMAMEMVHNESTTRPATSPCSFCSAPTCSSLHRKPRA